MHHATEENPAPGESYTAWLGELSRLRQEQRAQKGIYAGKPLNGYLKVPGSDIHVIDESKRQAIRRLFLEAPRKGFRELLEVADEEMLRNASDRQLGLSSLHNLLTNPFYAGMVKVAGNLVPGHHKAIVTVKEFERTQRALNKRRC